MTRRGVYQCGHGVVLICANGNQDLGAAVTLLEGAELSDLDGPMGSREHVNPTRSHGRNGKVMQQPERHTGLDEVELCTVRAAHRRDHDHGSQLEHCHPHVVEVVHLGDRAVMVCHDCRTDSGFIAHRQAEVLAGEHRHDTYADVPPAPGEHAA